MNKLIFIVGVLSGLSCQPDGTKVELAIDYIGDMQEWVIEDLNSGSMDSTIANYYLHHLSTTEELLIEIAD